MCSYNYNSQKHNTIDYNESSHDVTVIPNLLFNYSDNIIRSKLCNVLFTNELSFRLSGDLPFYLDEETKSLVCNMEGKAMNTLSQSNTLRGIYIASAYQC